MNIWLDLTAIVYLWSLFRHSEDWVSTYLELSSPEQAFTTAVIAFLIKSALKWFNRKR